MGIFMGAQSIHDNSTACDDSTDSQLDFGSPCYGDSKEGLHFRIALIFTHHFYFEGKATKAYMLLKKDMPDEKPSLSFLILCFYDNDRFLAL